MSIQGDMNVVNLLCLKEKDGIRFRHINLMVVNMFFHVYNYNI